MLYFDYAATTPVDPEVLETMLPWMNEAFYNASSPYTGGRRAKAAVEEARNHVAAFLDAEPGEVIFTSGGTEADNTAVIGTALAAGKRGRNRVVVSCVEHHAVLESCAFLETIGFQVTCLPVDQYGRVLPETLRRAMGEDVGLVSVMWVNNELGTIQDIPALSQIAHEFGAAFHTDAVQAVSTQPVSFKDCKADLLSISSHKIYGPKGCGALVIREGTEFVPLLHGGQQERGLRGGTENVPAIVGLGKAARLMAQSRETDRIAMERRKGRMIRCLTGPDVWLNSPPEYTAPSILNVAFRDVEAEGMLFYLGRQGYCASMGSACNSSSVEPSHVIQAIGLPEDFRRGCIRISFGHGQTEEECDGLAVQLLSLAGRLRN